MPFGARNYCPLSSGADQCLPYNRAPNVRYLTGFTGSNAALLLTGERALLFTDPRYRTQASRESDCEIRIAKGPLSQEIAIAVRRLGSNR